MAKFSFYISLCTLQQKVKLQTKCFSMMTTVVIWVRMTQSVKIELIHLSVLSTDNTNCKNDIHKFSNSLSDQESTENPINTYRC